jgi:hypothetical protein
MSPKSDAAELADLRADWHPAYDFALVDGWWTAWARFGSRQTLEADTAGELRTKVRHHYPGLCADRSST